MSTNLILRNVRPNRGALTDVVISDGIVTDIKSGVTAQADVIDGQGLTLLPGLIDHHIHLLATAAKRDSLDLSGFLSASDVAAHLRTAAPSSSGWIRAIGYDERAAGLLDRATLDDWRADVPIKVQDRTGALWMLNSLGIAAIGSPPFPDCVECDSSGLPTGRIWRGDAWLRKRLGTEAPSLARLGQELARYGITGVTDAGANNGRSEALLLGGALPQRLMLMGKEELPPSPHYQLGPLKLIFDERDIPDIETVAGRIWIARAQGRSVAAHCVTVGELLIYLAALDAAGGALPGDRIEHGSQIPASLIPDIARSGLTVVTQPGFVATRGDRYLAELPPSDLPDLYRLRSLLEAGIPVASGSDSPYGDINPWIGIKAAENRLTQSGQTISAQESITRVQGLALSLGDFSFPGGPQRWVTIGSPADLILIASAELEPVRLTLINGQVIHRSLD